MELKKENEAVSDKDELRRAIRRQRASLTLEQAWQVGQAAQMQLLRLPAWRAAGIVCCYLAVGREAGTELLLEDCRRHGRRVCVPAFCGDTEKYYPVWLAPDGALVPGPNKIPEPRDPVRLTDEKVDVVVVPGLAFDREGARLGHGCGYYDRLLTLANLRQALKIGLALEFQIVEKIPTRDWDVGMDIIVTEAGVYCNKGG